MSQNSNSKFEPQFEDDKNTFSCGSVNDPVCSPILIQLQFNTWFDIFYLLLELSVEFENKIFDMVDVWRVYVHIFALPFLAKVFGIRCTRYIRSLETLFIIWILSISPVWGSLDFFLKAYKVGLIACYPYQISYIVSICVIISWVPFKSFCFYKWILLMLTVQDHIQTWSLSAECTWFITFSVKIKVGAVIWNLGAHAPGTNSKIKLKRFWNFWKKRTSLTFL